MDVLVVGASGLLGTDVVTALLEADHEVTGLGRAELDVRTLDPDDATALHHAVGGHEVVVDAAGLSPEAAHRHPGHAFDVDAVGAQLLAAACARTGARLVHVSSADVVAGHAPGAPVPVEAPLRPVGSHGRAHAAGEWAVRASGADAVVVRAGWLYGAHGECLPRRLARLGREVDALRVPAVWQGQPTWTADVARVVVGLLEQRVPAGVYPASAMGWTDRFGWALEVWESLGRDLDVLEPVEAAGPDGSGTGPEGHDHGPAEDREHGEDHEHDHGDDHDRGGADGHGAEVLGGTVEPEGWSVLAPQPLRRLGVEPIGPWRLRWQEAADEVLADL
ncbi:SDR family oxidoreductase [Aquipuribacter sp. SD81]|uniref:SDR family oxidoreductase n=1 Tax=Aquipuribacter sp. SD81 TaxID=3127703 RepID=UPI00301826AA